MSLDTPKISHPALKQLVFYGNIHDKGLEEEKYSLIQNLEKEIDSKRQDKAKKGTNKFVLLVGDSIKSLEAIGSYVYCIRGSACTEFLFHSVGGMNEEEVKKILQKSCTIYSSDNKLKSGNLMEGLYQGCALFLGNMECRDSSLLKYLASVK